MSAYLRPELNALGHRFVACQLLFTFHAMIEVPSIMGTFVESQGVRMVPDPSPGELENRKNEDYGSVR